MHPLIGAGFEIVRTIVRMVAHKISDQGFINSKIKKEFFKAFIGLHCWEVQSLLFAVSIPTPPTYASPSVHLPICIPALYTCAPVCLSAYQDQPSGLSIRQDRDRQNDRELGYYRNTTTKNPIVIRIITLRDN